MGMAKVQVARRSAAKVVGDFMWLAGRMGQGKEAAGVAIGWDAFSGCGFFSGCGWPQKGARGAKKMRWCLPAGDCFEAAAVAGANGGGGEFFLDSSAGGGAQAGAEGGVGVEAAHPVGGVGGVGIGPVLAF